MGKAIVSESVSTHTFADVDDLINAGKPRPAENLLRTLQDEGSYKKDPDFWFRILLVSNLLNRPLQDIEAVHVRAQDCEGWSETMEADYLRDMALRHIRAIGISYASPVQVAHIERLIDSGVRRVLHDPNRQASFTAVRARLLIAQGKFQEAVEACVHADEQWAAIKGSVDQQWIRNNHFHWFIALRRQLSTKELLWANMARDGRNSPLVHQVEYSLDGVVNDPEERNGSRKAMAYLIFYTGRLGHLVYRLSVKYYR